LDFGAPMREQPNGGHYYLLKAGDRFDRTRLAPATAADR
jgi:hypothetical protein